jgi:RNA-binding protein
LDKKFRRDRKAAAETLAREKRLPRVQVGAKGITQPVVDSCLDVLMKHELLRVKLGEGCGLEREEAMQLLEELLDAVAVHAIGFTITLYRQQGLPRPSNYHGSGSEGGVSTSSSDDEDDASSAGGSQQQQQQQQRTGKPKATAGSRQQKPVKKRTPKPPPPQEAKPPSVVVL